MPRTIQEIKARARKEMLATWKNKLASANREGHQSRNWIYPVLDKWLDRGREQPLHFHLIQMMSDYGCFVTYLFRIGREETPICRFCDMEVRDDHQHTMMACGAWDAIREEEGWPDLQNAPA